MDQKTATENFQITIIGTTFFSISILLSIMTLIFSFKIRLYKQFSIELLIYVLFSTILFDITKFLSVLRAVIQDELIEEILIGNEIFWRMYPDTVINIAILIHTIKIYDAIIKGSQWFVHNKVKVLCRCILFIFPLIYSILFIFIQKQSTLGFDKTQICSRRFFCTLRGDVFYASQITDIFCILIIIVLIIYSFCFLKKSVKNNKHYSSRTLLKIKTASCRVWIYPIVVYTYWIFRFVTQILLNNEKYPAYLDFLGLVLVSLRGSLFSIVLILTQDNLKNEILKALFCYKRKEEINGNSEEEGDTSMDSYTEIEFRESQL